LIVNVQGLPKNGDQPESCTQVLTYITCFHRSTRALTQAEPHLAAAPEQLHLTTILLKKPAADDCRFLSLN